jgi:hypothetical protein
MQQAHQMGMREFRSRSPADQAGLLVSGISRNELDGGLARSTIVNFGKEDAT